MKEQLKKHWRTVVLALGSLILGLIIGVAVGPNWTQPETVFGRLWHLAKPTDATSFWTFVLVLVALAALRSLGLTKKDMEDRSTREAREIAIERCEEFATHLVNENGEIWRALTAKGLKPFRPADQVIFGAAETETLIKEAQKWAATMPTDSWWDCIEFINDLEAWAMYFAQGVADHDIAFAPCGPLFCTMVGNYYGLLVFCREKSTSGKFRNVVELFEDWSARLKKEQLSLRQDDVNKELAELAKRPKLRAPIGTADRNKS